MSPLTFGAPDPVPGIAVPCPPVRGYWFEGVTAPVEPRLVVQPVADITVVTEAEEGGSAIAEIVVGADGSPGYQVTIERTSVWDTVLVDSFEATPGPNGSYLCPLVDGSDPVGAGTRIFMGRGDAGGILLLTRGNQELGSVVEGFARPNVVAPGGLSTRCLFRNVYLTSEGPTGGIVRLTPVVDGERLTDETIVFAVQATGTSRSLHRYEVPLGRAHSVSAIERSRAGLVGTWFTVELEILDAFGCGRLELGGLEVEYSVLEEGIPQEVFTGESGTAPLLGTTQTWFMAGVGDGVLRGRDGTDDAGQDIAVRARSNDVAPAGAAGECVFMDVYLAVARRNTTDWTIQVTAIVDDEELATTAVTLAGVVQPVTEVVAVSLAQPHMVNGVERSRYHPRGAWAAVLITATDAPDAEVIFIGAELDYEVVRESLEDVTNA